MEQRSSSGKMRKLPNSWTVLFSRSSSDRCVERAFSRSRCNEIQGSCGGTSAVLLNAVMNFMSSEGFFLLIFESCKVAENTVLDEGSA